VLLAARATYCIYLPHVHIRVGGFASLTIFLFCSRQRRDREQISEGYANCEELDQDCWWELEKSGNVRRASPLTRYRALNSALDSQSLLKHMKPIHHVLGQRIQRFLCKGIIFSKTTQFMRFVYSALRISVYADSSFLPAPSSKRRPNSILPATPPSCSNLISSHDVSDAIHLLCWASA
jgi:hypothetical protein